MNTPLFDFFKKQPIPKRLFECSGCESDFYGAEWELRVAGWKVIGKCSKVGGEREFARCPKCQTKDQHECGQSRMRRRKRSTRG